MWPAKPLKKKVPQRRKASALDQDSSNDPVSFHSTPTSAHESVTTPPGVSGTDAGFAGRQNHSASNTSDSDVMSVAVSDSDRRFRCGPQFLFDGVKRTNL